jgi:large subunit ribosomal protein L31
MIDAGLAHDRRHTQGVGRLDLRTRPTLGSKCPPFEDEERRTRAVKEKIHPSYPGAKVVCACGNNFVTRSTRGDFAVDVCSNCHPFYTGKQKLMDTQGRVDRYRRKYEKVTPPVAK